MTDPRFPDRLSLIGMRHLARHGVEAREKEEVQLFAVDLVLHADLDRAAREDDLAATVDYAGLRDLVEAIVIGRSYDLIEALAGAIARAVLAATDPDIVGAVEVRVRKPQALTGDLDGPEVTLVRRRAAG